MPLGQQTPSTYCKVAHIKTSWLEAWFRFYIWKFGVYLPLKKQMIWTRLNLRRLSNPFLAPCLYAAVALALDVLMSYPHVFLCFYILFPCVPGVFTKFVFFIHESLVKTQAHKNKNAPSEWIFTPLCVLSWPAPFFFVRVPRKVSVFLDQSFPLLNEVFTISLVTSCTEFIP